jgi:hypothetical protein
MIWGIDYRKLHQTHEERMIAGGRGFSEEALRYRNGSQPRRRGENSGGEREVCLIEPIALTEPQSDKTPQNPTRETISELDDDLGPEVGNALFFDTAASVQQHLSAPSPS